MQREKAGRYLGFLSSWHGCSGSPPAAYEHPRDQFFAAIPLTIIDADFRPCFRTVDGRPARLADADCYSFTNAERMRGVSISGFETGSFYPGRITLPQRGEQSGFWMDLDPRLLPTDVRSRCGEGYALRLDFIGRRTAVQGAYGPWGMAGHIILVDRVLEATLLE